MKTFKLLFVAIVLFMGATSLTHAQSKIAHINTSELVQAMPAMKHNQCITRENAVPDSAQQDQECKMIKTAVNGDTVSWNMVCDSPEGKSNLTGEVTYHGDTFKGMLKIDIQGMEMVQRMSGRRIGECNQ